MGSHADLNFKFIMSVNFSQIVKHYFANNHCFFNPLKSSILYMAANNCSGSKHIYMFLPFTCSSFWKVPKWVHCLTSTLKWQIYVLKFSNIRLTQNYRCETIFQSCCNCSRFCSYSCYKSDWKLSKANPISSAAKVKLFMQNWCTTITNESYKKNTATITMKAAATNRRQQSAFCKEWNVSQVSLVSNWQNLENKQLC